MSDVMGFKERIQYVNTSDYVESKAGVVMVDASAENIVLVLPNPEAFRYNTLAIVAVDATNGIELAMPEGASWLDDSNVELNQKGDSLVLISDRDSQWICISRYTAFLEY